MLSCPPQLQGKYEEADAFFIRVIDSQERTLGSDHPDLATTLDSRAVVLSNQVSKTCDKLPRHVEGLRHESSCPPTRSALLTRRGFNVEVPATIAKVCRVSQ